MKLGDSAILKSKKKRIPVTVMHDHTQDDPPFPAVTIRKGEKKEEYIVGRHEIISPEELASEMAAHLQNQKDSVADVVAAFEAGNISYMAIAKHLGKQLCEILSRVRKAERLGLVKVVKEAK